jgi:hypothetical protein
MIDTNNSFCRQSLINVHQDQRLDIDYSMILGKDNKDKNQQLEAIN